MRFLFECVSCCLMTTPSSYSSSTGEPSSPAATSTAEETRTLVTPSPTQARLGGRRRKRPSSRANSVAADWRPSLFAISEDNVIQAAAPPAEKVEKRQVVVGPPASANRNVKRCGPSSVRVNANHRSRDFSYDPVQMVVPAWSAAPFMF